MFCKKVCYFFLADTIFPEFMPRLSFVLSVYRNKAWQSGYFLLRVEPLHVTLSPQLKQTKARRIRRREELALAQKNTCKKLCNSKHSTAVFAGSKCTHTWKVMSSQWLELFLPPSNSPWAKQSKPRHGAEARSINHLGQTSCHTFRGWFCNFYFLYM